MRLWCNMSISPANVYINLHVTTNRMPRHTCYKPQSKQKINILPSKHTHIYTHKHTHTYIYNMITYDYSYHKLLVKLTTVVTSCHKLLVKLTIVVTSCQWHELELQWSCNGVAIYFWFISDTILYSFNFTD